MDVNVLDSLLYNFQFLQNSGINNVRPYAMGTLGILMTIDFILAIILNLDDGDKIKTTITKILKYGFWIFIITHWGWIIDTTLQSFKMVGLAVGGNQTMLDLVNHPSKIVWMGTEIVMPLVTGVTKLNSVWLVFTNGFIFIMTILTILSVMIAFMFMAIQVFITYVEFYIASACLLIFLPFGSNKHTSFIAEKALGAIISYGVKLLVLSCVLGISLPIMYAWIGTLNETPTFPMLYGVMCASGIIAFLAWHAPGMAAGLMSGSPTLTTGTVAGSAMAAGAAVVGAGMAVASGGASLAGTAGAMAGGASSAAAGGGGALAQAVGAIQGGASHIGNAMTGGMKDSFNTGFAGQSGGGSSGGSGGSSGGSGSSTTTTTTTSSFMSGGASSSDSSGGSAGSESSGSGSSGENGGATGSAPNTNTGSGNSSGGSSSGSGKSGFSGQSGGAASRGSSSASGGSSGSSTGKASSGSVSSPNTDTGSSSGGSGDGGVSSASSGGESSAPNTDTGSSSGGSGDGGNNISGFTTTTTTTTTTSPSDSSSEGNTQSSGGSNGFMSTAAVISQAQRAIPPEASPTGGIHAPIKHEKD